MRWFRPDGPLGIAALVLAAVAFRVWLLPVATDGDAPDELLGLAQLAWLVLCLLVGLAVVLLLLRLTRIGRRP